MKITNISKRAFLQLQPMVLSRNILNTEAELYYFNYKNEKKVFKKLYNSIGDTFANKLYTLEMLDTYRNCFSSNFCIPDSLCSINNEIVGFTMPRIDGTNLTTLLSTDKVNYKEQLKYLRNVGEILKQLENIRKYTGLKDIYISDLHDSNFLVDNDTKQIKVVDLDSCKIGENSPSVARFLTPFSLLNESKKYNLNPSFTGGYVVADENSDLYCYNIMILNYIFGINVGRLDIIQFYNFLCHLETIGMDKNLINSFRKIILNCDNSNPMEYVETIKENQLIKARYFAKKY